MKTLPIAEFRDPDGSYVLVQPLDEVRCRVIDSNVTLKGEVLYKDRDLSWKQAQKDCGGYTRVGADELLRREEKDQLDHATEMASLGGRPARAISIPEIGEGEGPFGDGIDIDAEHLGTLERLQAHYLNAHWHHDEKGSWTSLCNCPGYGPSDEQSRDRLNAVVSIVVSAGRIPPLHRIIRTVRVFETWLGRSA